MLSEGVVRLNVSGPADGCDLHDDDPPDETAELCCLAADHLMNARNRHSECVTFSFSPCKCRQRGVPQTRARLRTNEFAINASGTDYSWKLGLPVQNPTFRDSKKLKQSHILRFLFIVNVPIWLMQLDVCPVRMNVPEAESMPTVIAPCIVRVFVPIPLGAVQDIDIVIVIVPPFIMP
jgi:hypothetical protein